MNQVMERVNRIEKTIETTYRGTTITSAEYILLVNKIMARMAKLAENIKP